MTRVESRKELLREKRRREKKRRILFIAILSALVLIISGVLIVWKVYTVENVVVKGNEHYSAEQIQKLVEALQDEETEAIDIKVAHIPDLNLNHFTSSVLTKENSDIADTQIKEAPEKTDAYQVQTSRLYHIAEAFIRVMRENYK